MIVPLREAHDEKTFGGKAVQLGAAIRAGLPVPDGFALSTDAVNRARELLDELEEKRASLGDLIAVRSSGVGEDSAGASFAGQHATILGVHDRKSLEDAIAKVHASAHSASALAYRARLGLSNQPKIAVVLQTLVRAEVAGVLFTKNPMTGADERVIEGSWGLGEAVVAGLVTPDRFRLSRDGTVLERAIGEKDLRISWAPGGGTIEEEVSRESISISCLDDRQLGALNELAARCESHFGGTQDIEWAFVGNSLHLLQRRAITRSS
ncbi:MAG: PEP/pyruvate-binding domain-containing protein [Polyangiales bacterium]